MGWDSYSTMPRIWDMVGTSNKYQSIGSWNGHGYLAVHCLQALDFGQDSLFEVDEATEMGGEGHPNV